MKPQDLNYIEHNKIEYKGIIMDVTPEFIQGVMSLNISFDEVISHVNKLYQNKLSEIRDNKLKLLGI